MDKALTDRFADFRDRFLGAKQSIYMDVAARGTHFDSGPRGN